MKLAINRRVLAAVMLVVGVVASVVGCSGGPSANSTAARNSATASRASTRTAPSTVAPSTDSAASYPPAFVNGHPVFSYGAYGDVYLGEPANELKGYIGSKVVPTATSCTRYEYTIADSPLTVSALVEGGKVIRIEGPLIGPSDTRYGSYGTAQGVNIGDTYPKLVAAYAYLRQDNITVQYYDADSPDSAQPAKLEFLMTDGVSNDSVVQQIATSLIFAGTGTISGGIGVCGE